MSLHQVDKTIIKSILKKILDENPSMVKKTIYEIAPEIKENQASVDIIIDSLYYFVKNEEKDKESVENIIDSHFEKYKNVFKALA